MVEVCRDLLSSPSLPPGAVAARDIGVIAAFRKQVLKLRLALRQAGMSNVNVGSVEDFQVSMSGVCHAGCDSAFLFSETSALHIFKLVC